MNKYATYGRYWKEVIMWYYKKNFVKAIFQRKLKNRQKRCFFKKLSTLSSVQDFHASVSAYAPVKTSVLNFIIRAWYIDHRKIFF